MSPADSGPKQRRLSTVASLIAQAEGGPTATDPGPEQELVVDLRAQTARMYYRAVTPGRNPVGDRSHLGL